MKRSRRVIYQFSPTDEALPDLDGGSLVFEENADPGDDVQEVLACAVSITPALTASIVAALIPVITTVAEAAIVAARTEVTFH